jgi:hypothetical protein
MIHDDHQMKAIAPNMGAVDSECSLQVSGVIQIPTSCILHITKLAEISGSAVSAPASDPD